MLRRFPPLAIATALVLVSCSSESEPGGLGTMTGSGGTGGVGAAPGSGASAGSDLPAGGTGSGGASGSSAGTASSSGSAGMNGGAGETGTAGEGAVDTPADGCAGGNQIDFALRGWATEEGGTTGGKDGDTVTVSSGAELVEALEAKQDSDTPLTILIDATITEANSGVEKIDVKDVTDVSLIGLGAGAEFDGIGIKIVRASNIVVRNLKIHHVDIGDKDAISIEGPADHIWVDHCELYAEFEGVDKDYYDGLLDVKGESAYITYSWNHLHDSWKTSLVGSSETDTFDRKITMHHNYYSGCNSRLPLFRGGNGHLFNNYFVDIADTTINSRLGACIRIENNSFQNAKNPWVSAFSDELGAGELVCNVTDAASVFAYADDVHELPSCAATVPYDYADVLNHGAHVPALVEANAGVGKLVEPQAF
jgi:pectate lyase